MVETTQTQRHLKELTGTVVRATMQKTIVVEVARLASHPLYRKVIRHRKRYFVHDEKGIGKAGDKVRIVQTRPISKRKNWRLLKVLESS